MEMVKNLQWAKNFHNFYIFKTARFQKFLADSNLQSRRRSWNFVTGHPRPTKSRLNLANTVIFLQTYPDWLKPDSSSSTFSCFHDFCNFKTAHFQELLEMGGSSFGSGNWKSLSACVSGAKSRLNLANTVFSFKLYLSGKFGNSPYRARRPKRSQSCRWRGWPRASFKVLNAGVSVSKPGSSSQGRTLW